MRGVIPVDLKEEKIWWRSLPFLDRLEIVKKFNNDKRLIASITATSMLEQPTLIPNNNGFGFMPWGKKFPWGWKEEFFVKRPSGYFLAKEGKTKKIAVFFSFSYFADCVQVISQIFKKRKIYTYDDYQKNWLGGKNPGGRKIWEDYYNKAIKILNNLS